MLQYSIKILFVASLFMIAACDLSDVDVDPGNPDDDVQKFVGSWSVWDQPARLNYSVTIKRSPADEERVILENFADMGTSASGLVVNNNIVIDEQDLDTGIKTEGSGVFKNENKLEFEFFLDDGIDKELRKAVFSR